MLSSFNPEAIHKGASDVGFRNLALFYCDRWYLYSYAYSKRWAYVYIYYIIFLKISVSVRGLLT